MATARKRKLDSTAVTVESVVPPEVAGRYKRVYSRSEEVAHEWAAGHLPEGRSSNLYFEGGVIYSYGRHFPAARHVRSTVRGVTGPGVFVTTRTYSSTTAGHLSDIRRAIRGRSVDVFEVDNVMASTVAEHRANFAALRKEFGEKLVKAGKARKYGPMLIGEAASLVRMANRYAEFTGIPDRIDDDESRDLEGRAAAAAEQAKEYARKQLAADRRKLAADVKEWEGELAEWLRFGRDRLRAYPVRNDPKGDHVYLRAKLTDGGRPSILQTSLGAAVPFAAAVPLLGAVRGAAEVPPGTMIGSFTLDRIDRDARVVKIGCHTITFGEIERLAAELGL